MKEKKTAKLMECAVSKGSYRLLETVVILIFFILFKHELFFA